MSFSVGIVGLPNVGKSTLFSALTKKQVPASNYPFCTIEPNVGCVAVPDSRLDQLALLYNSAKTIYSTIDFVDIAGLVKGASKGEGLGNKFLSHIREVDAICHVIRLFEDKNIVSVTDDFNPQRDLEIIDLELILSDLEQVNKRLENLQKQTKSGKQKDVEKRISVLSICKETLEQEKLLHTLELDDEQKDLVKDIMLITIKPKLFILNVSEKQYALAIEELPLPQSLKGKEDQCIKICARLEAELIDLPKEEVTEYLEASNITHTGLDQLIIKAYKTLNLITYFTVGPKEAHAWTITCGMNAKQSAGKIHSDFEEGFIKAETISCSDVIQAGSEIKAKELGLMRMEGKEYIVQDGDVMHFHFAK